MVPNVVIRFALETCSERPRRQTLTWTIFYEYRFDTGNIANEQEKPKMPHYSRKQAFIETCYSALR